MFGIVELGSGLGLGQLFHKGVLSLHRHVWGSGIGMGLKQFSQQGGLSSHSKIGIRTILPARRI